MKIEQRIVSSNYSSKPAFKASALQISSEEFFNLLNRSNGGKFKEIFPLSYRLSNCMDFFNLRDILQGCDIKKAEAKLFEIAKLIGTEKSKFRKEFLDSTPETQFSEVMFKFIGVSQQFHTLDGSFLLKQTNAKPLDVVDAIRGLPNAFSFNRGYSDLVKFMGPDMEKVISSGQMSQFKTLPMDGEALDVILHHKYEREPAVKIWQYLNFVNLQPKSTRQILLEPMVKFLEEECIVPRFLDDLVKTEKKRLGIAS